MTLLHRSRGLRVSRHRATTAQLPALYPFHADEGIGMRGVYIGENLAAGGTAWCFDPFTAYADGHITSPNIAIVGAVGSGKSTAVKTLVARTVGQLASPGGQPRWCAILDPKGEYQPLAEHLGLAWIRPTPGTGGIRLNPLDPGPGTPPVDELIARRTQITGALAAATLHRDLTPTEDAVLAWTLAHLTHTNPAPTLIDLLDALTDPPAEVLNRARSTADHLRADTINLRHGLVRLIEGPLRGMFDGASTLTIDWTGRGLVLDLSAVHHDPDALTVVMIAATGWLQALLAAPEGGQVPRRIQVLEEIWALLGSDRVARYFQSCQKLSRTYGVANVSVAHRVADLSSQADDGTAAAKIAAGLLADTQVRLLFRQSPDQIPDATQHFALSPVEAQLLPTLGRGVALWRVGTHAARVRHRIAPSETALIDTDQNLRP